MPLTINSSWDRGRLVRRSGLAGLGAVLGAGLGAGLTGCEPSSRAGPGGSEAQAPGAASGASSPAGGAPRRLRVATSFAIASLYPPVGRLNLVQYGTAQTLYYVNPDQTVRPWVANAIERDGDTGWTIRLRPEARFHNGKPIDSAGVLACVERYLEAGTSAPSLRGARWEAPDARMLRVQTSQPDPWFPHYMASSAFFPLFDPAEVPVNPDPATLVGKRFFSGPFWARDLTVDQLTLDAVPDAWDGAPRLAGVDVMFVRDAQARLAALRSGEIDMVVYPPADAVPQIKAAPGLVWKSTPMTELAFVAFNHRKPPLNEARVRQAVSLAIDRPQIADKVLNGAYRAPDSIFAPGAPWSLRGVLRTDLAAARKLLDEGGWAPGPDGIRRKGGQRLAFELLHYPQQPDSKPMAEAMQAQLKAVGVEVRLKQTDSVDQTMRNGDFEAGISYNDMQPAGNPVDPLVRRFRTNSADNWGGWGSAEMDRLIDQASTEFDPARRDQVFKQLQELWKTEMPITFSVSKHWAVVVNQAFANYVPSSMVQHYMVTKDTAPAGA